jgi:TonB family protein
MKNRRKNLLGAFLISLAIHAVAGVCVVTWISLSTGNTRPMFRRGESSVMVTFLPMPAKREPGSAEPKNDEPLHPLRAVKSLAKEVRAEDVDGDPFEKGVEAVVAGETEIRPRYPFRSRVRGEEGVVTLAVRICASGRAEEVEVVTSSGHSALDRAAVSAVRKARFTGARGPSIRTRLSFRFELLDRR